MAIGLGEDTREGQAEAEGGNSKANSEPGTTWPATMPERPASRYTLPLDRVPVRLRPDARAVGAAWGAATGMVLLAFELANVTLPRSYGNGTSLLAILLGPVLIRRDLELLTNAVLICAALLLASGLWAQHAALAHGAYQLGLPLRVSLIRWLAVNVPVALLVQLIMWYGTSIGPFIAMLAGFGDVNVIYYSFALSIVGGWALGVGFVCGMVSAFPQRAMLRRNLAAQNWELWTVLGWALGLVLYCLGLFFATLRFYMRGLPGPLVVLAGAITGAIILALFAARLFARSLARSAEHAAKVQQDGHLPAARAGVSPWIVLAGSVVAVVAVYAGAQMAIAQRSDYAVQHPVPRVAAYYTLDVGPMYSKKSLAFSPDGSLLATLTENRDINLISRPSDVTVWRTSDKVLLYKIHYEHDPGYVPSVAFSPDGKTLATGWGDKLELRRAEDGTVQRTLSGKHIGNNVTFSPDWQFFVSDNADSPSQGRNGAPRLWRARDGQQIPLTGGPDRDGLLYGVAFSADSRTVTVIYWRSVVIWEVQSGAVVKKLGLDDMLGVNGWSVYGSVFTSDGEIVAVSNNPQVQDTRLFELPGLRPLRKVFIDGRRGGDMAFSPDGKFLAVSMPDARVRVVRAENSDPVADLVMEGATSEEGDVDIELNVIEFSPDGKEVVGAVGDNMNTGDMSGGLRFWRFP